ncbi:hypothetical protein H696_00912 [Fonticula alba]|uniref:Vacuolar protein-sorting-associated protein 36 n=1 Tax=Fonticula alba TaxID=691883 RepID=A0A058ZHF7_FONAL|nr:hypothetical protein H696_00912 [Fonticula alba]KCV73373.1 hypothetical protein H696_00912 [Fonticula alba]|eukprot:XP_009493074.1 hypothetical protein H696_00912 [Fonticula alba]
MSNPYSPYGTGQAPYYGAPPPGPSPYGAYPGAAPYPPAGPYGATPGANPAPYPPYGHAPAPAPAPARPSSSYHGSTGLAQPSSGSGPYYAPAPGPSGLYNPTGSQMAPPSGPYSPYGSTTGPYSPPGATPYPSGPYMAGPYAPAAGNPATGAPGPYAPAASGNAGTPYAPAAGGGGGGGGGSGGNPSYAGPVPGGSPYAPVPGGSTHSPYGSGSFTPATPSNPYNTSATAAPSNPYAAPATAAPTAPPPGAPYSATAPVVASPYSTSTGSLAAGTPTVPVVSSPYATGTVPSSTSFPASQGPPTPYSSTPSPAPTPYTSDPKREPPARPSPYQQQMSPHSQQPQPQPQQPHNPYTAASSQAPPGIGGQHATPAFNPYENFARPNTPSTATPTASGPPTMTTTMSGAAPAAATVPAAAPPTETLLPSLSAMAVSSQAAVSSFDDIPLADPFQFTRALEQQAADVSALCAGHHPSHPSLRRVGPAAGTPAAGDPIPAGIRADREVVLHSQADIALYFGNAKSPASHPVTATLTSHRVLFTEASADGTPTPGRASWFLELDRVRALGRRIAMPFKSARVLLSVDPPLVGDADFTSFLGHHQQESSGQDTRLERFDERVLRVRCLLPDFQPASTIHSLVQSSPSGQSARQLVRLVEPRIAATLPNQVDWGQQIHLSFRAGGQPAFLAALEKALQRRDWLRQAVQHLNDERSRNTTSTRQSGIAQAMAAAAASRQRALETVNTEASDLETLMFRAQAIVELVKAHNVRLKRQQAEEHGEESTDSLDQESSCVRDYLQDLGITSPVTRDTAGGDYWQALSRELSSFVGRLLQRKNVQAITLTDLFCDFNRARGAGALVSPADLARAADLLPSVSSTGSGRFATRRLPSGVVLVLNADTFTDDAVVDRVLNLFPDNESPDAATGVTPADVAVAERVGIILAQEFLMLAERTGLLCRDESVQGLRFFRNHFQTAL